jgi:hypothetical protein
MNFLPAINILSCSRSGLSVLYSSNSSLMELITKDHIFRILLFPNVNLTTYSPQPAMLSYYTQ